MPSDRVENEVYQKGSALNYLRAMDVGEHATVICPDLDIEQNELVKTEEGWEVYTGFGRIEVDWQTIKQEVEDVV